jgi:hypothetical protein
MDGWQEEGGALRISSWEARDGSGAIARGAGIWEKARKLFGLRVSGPLIHSCDRNVAGRPLGHGGPGSKGHDELACVFRPAGAGNVRSRSIARMQGRLACTLLALHQWRCPWRCR